MASPQAQWKDLSDRLEGLALKLKLHFEQAHDEQLSETLARLRGSVEDAFEAAGNAVKDDAVRQDVRDVGRLLADAVASTLTKVADDIRDATKGKT